MLILLRDRAEHPAGHADRDDARGDGLFHDAASADDGAVADRRPGEDDGARADPYVVAHGDGRGDLQPAPALLRVERVLRRREADVGADEHVVAERDGRAVRDHEIVIGIKVVAHRNVVAVIAPERRGDDRFFPHRAEQLCEDLCLRLPVVGAETVEAEAFVLALPYLFFKSRVVTALEKYAHGRLYLCHDILLRPNLCRCIFMLFAEVEIL